ncbi:hypothetical protein GOODEAATRI_015036, partial [Goodea atripinnis]
VTAVYWISIQFATWFPADFKYSRKPLQTNFKLVASWLLDQTAPVISEPCSPSNVLLCKYLHPVLHTSISHTTDYARPDSLRTTIKYLKTNLPWINFPPQDISGAVLPDSTSLFPSGGSVISPFGDLPVLNLLP